MSVGNRRKVIFTKADNDNVHIVSRVHTQPPMERPARERVLSLGGKVAGA
jgi:hypothetical protein